MGGGIKALDEGAPELAFGMSRRTLLFCALAVTSAAIFSFLGFWQLGRLSDRRAHNAIIAHQRLDAPGDVRTLPADTGEAHYRATSVTGRLDYAHEVVLAGRTHQGSPGVELLTPVRIAGTDTAVLVNRGWVYSPDAGTVDLARWHERSDTLPIRGYVETYAPDAGVTTSSANGRLVRRVSRSEIAARVPYPVAPWYVVVTGDSADGVHPARRDLPVLDDGPHRSYAVQWFFFAAIALAGATAVVIREREPRTLHAVAPPRQ